MQAHFDAASQYWKMPDPQNALSGVGTHQLSMPYPCKALFHVGTSHPWQHSHMQCCILLKHSMMEQPAANSHLLYHESCLAAKSYAILHAAQSWHDQRPSSQQQSASPLSYCLVQMQEPVLQSAQVLQPVQQQTI